MIEKILQDMPELGKITPDVMNAIAIRMHGEPLDMSKTWGENGYDDLDSVEMIMELEKELNIVIPDHIADILVSGDSKPPRFTSFIRDKKLNQLGL